METLKSKIEKIISSKAPLTSTFKFYDGSTQARLSVTCIWHINLPVDYLHYPKSLAAPDTAEDAWYQMRCLERAISAAATCACGDENLGFEGNARTKSGARARDIAKKEFVKTQQAAFLIAYHKASLKTALKKQNKKIADLQAQQKTLMVGMREHNSRVISARKTSAAAQREKNEIALKTGEFWKADEKTLKLYFHPPFARNYCADISERWRAALYTEMDSTAWKAGRGDWRHKNIGTGRAYLCGIDDNGDEWGVRVDLQMNRDYFGDLGYAGVTVGDAMSELYNIDKISLQSAVRQGDLLFCFETIPANVELHDQEGGAWKVRESHEIQSDGLRHNGQCFISANVITVTHTSHAPVKLPPGQYRLYQATDED